MTAGKPSKYSKYTASPSGAEGMAAGQPVARARRIRRAKQVAGVAIVLALIAIALSSLRTSRSDARYPDDPADKDQFICTACGNNFELTPRKAHEDQVANHLKEGQAICPACGKATGAPAKWENGKMVPGGGGQSMTVTPPRETTK